MAKLIALKTLLPDVFKKNFVQENFFSRIKQESLLFDQIGILKLDFSIKTIKETTKKLGEVFPEMEYEWLKDNKIIVDPFVEYPRWMRQNDANVNDNNYKSLLVILQKKTKEFVNRTIRAEKSNDIIDIKDALISAADQHLVLLRLLSIDMEKVIGVSAVSILSDINFMREIPDSNKSNVTKVVINKLPLPDQNTPWEQILDYKNASENQKNLVNLRRWIRKISTEISSPNEIEEEIEWLMNEFQNHMKLHKMKANTETLEVIVKVLPETIENLIKLRFSKLPEPFFAIKKRQINLMEAELNAPGREMAYIIKSRDTFQSDE